MNMIFEVQDLAVASPATVSRCGMVYVEPSQIGWRPLRDSWMKTLPENLTEVRAEDVRHSIILQYTISTDWGSASVDFRNPLDFLKK